MPHDEPWAPPNNHDQSCAFCGAARPAFVHRLHPDRVEFRLYGKGATLPSYWATCARCDALVADGDDDALVRLMLWEQEDEVERRATLTTFHAADLGSEPLPEGPPDTVRP